MPPGGIHALAHLTQRPLLSTTGRRHSLSPSMGAIRHPALLLPLSSNYYIVVEPAPASLVALASMTSIGARRVMIVGTKPARVKGRVSRYYTQKSTGKVRSIRRPVLGLCGRSCLDRMLVSVALYRLTCTHRGIA